MRTTKIPSWARPTRFALLGALLLLAASQIARAETGESEQLRLLREGTLAERREALQWLARAGGATSVPGVVESLRDPSGAVRKLAEESLWAIWSRSGDGQMDEALRLGGYLMANGKLRQAVQVFDRVIQRLPGFAEGYNKRATALYLLGEYRRSLDDIALTLQRNPYHFGALSGAGYCLIRLDRMDDALTYLRRALKINPNLDRVRELAKEIESSLGRRAI